MHRLATGGAPRSRMRHVLLWMDALYWTSFGLLKNNSHSLSLEEPGRFFKITLIGFIRKKKVIIGWLDGE